MLSAFVREGSKKAGCYKPVSDRDARSADGNNIEIDKHFSVHPPGGRKRNNEDKVERVSGKVSGSLDNISEA